MLGLVVFAVCFRLFCIENIEMFLSNIFVNLLQKIRERARAFHFIITMPGFFIHSPASDRGSASPWTPSSSREPSYRSGSTSPPRLRNYLICICSVICFSPSRLSRLQSSWTGTAGPSAFRRRKRTSSRLPLRRSETDSRAFLFFSEFAALETLPRSGTGHAQVDPNRL